MKINYHDPRPIQPPVSPVQEEMRQSRPRGLPVLRAFFLLMLLGGVGFAAAKVWRGRQLFAYGVVASRTDEIRTPYPATVRGLCLRPGDRVRQGQLLCQFVPLETENQARAIKAYLAGLDAPTSATQGAATPADRDYGEALAKLQAAQADYAQAEQRRRYDLEKARIEYGKVQTHYQMRQSRYEKVRELQRLDAAVASDVEAARNEMELAQSGLAQAGLDLKAARGAVNPFASQVELARRQLEEAQGRRQAEGRERRATLGALVQDLGVELNPRLPLDPARLGLTVGAPARVPLTITAPYDGVATEVAASDGRVLGAEQPVLSLTETGQSWIDAFIDPAKSDRIAPGQRVRAYIGGRAAPHAGTIASIAGVATDVPAVLAAQMPEVRRAIYCRVELETEGKGGKGVDVAPGEIARVVVE
jgi:multidrug resistance efflux pump